LEFEQYYVFSVYVPNSKDDLSRLEYRTTEWDNSFLNYLLYLQQTKPVLIGGDFNVAYDKNMDIWNPKIKNVPGATQDERESFRFFLEHFIDTFREKYPKKVLYSWWSNFNNCRTRNIGWRLDYFLLSKNCTIDYESDVLCNVMGSDHCPILYSDTY
jgi:exodeoxyribonuclease-3